MPISEKPQGSGPAVRFLGGYIHAARHCGPHSVSELDWNVARDVGEDVWTNFKCSDGAAGNPRGK